MIPTTHTKCLGVLQDQNLSWHQHFENTETKTKMDF